MSADTLSWVTNSTDALFVVTAALAMWFRYRAVASRPAGAGARPGWGGEVTPAQAGKPQPRTLNEHELQASLWLKLLMVSMAMATAANIALRLGA